MRVSVFGNRIQIGNIIASGVFVEGTTGEAITTLDVCYIKASDELIYKLDTTISEVNTALVLMALETIASGSSGRFMIQGTIEYSSWALTPGDRIEVGAVAGQFVGVAE